MRFHLRSVVVPAAIVLSAATLSAALTGCASPGADLSVADDTLSMSPDATNENAEALIAVTEFLNLRLPMQAGTGYQWELAKPLGDKAPVALASSETAPAGDPTVQQVGGRQWYLITFVGQNPGNQTITMVYRRPWETGVAPAKTYTVNVTVTKTQQR
jgi:inhibitor of cysteine peptidase